MAIGMISCGVLWCEWFCNICDDFQDTMCYMLHVFQRHFNPLDYSSYKSFEKL